jgi:hypothetical protein
MIFTLIYSELADQQLDEIEGNPALSNISRVLSKTLALMETNLRHPGLKTHKYHSLSGPNGEEIFEAYVQNKTPGAYRIFWYYGPDKNQITILAITTHP